MALSGLAQQNIPQSRQPATPAARSTFGQANSSTQMATPVAPAQRQVVNNAPSAMSPMPNSGPQSGAFASSGQDIDGITDKDISFLTSLAAMQVQYGRPHEAVAYLMTVRRLRPSDPQILRLLAIALMKMEAWEQANVILDELESLSRDDGPIVYLYRSIIRFRQSDLFGAKQLFARFCALKSGGNA